MQPFVLHPLNQLVELKLLRADFEARTAKGKRDQPDMEAAKTAVYNELQSLLTNKLWLTLNAELREGIAEVFDGHELRQGERPGGRTAAAVAWDEALGEALEAYLGGDIARICGAGWIGETVIGPRLDDPAVRERIAGDCARRVAAAVAESIQPAELGLDESDIEAIARLRIPAKATAPRRSEPAGDPGEAVRLLGGHLEELADIGRLPAEASYVQELELIGDFDEVLTPGAVVRLGLEPEIVPHVVAYREANGEAWAQKLFREALEPPQEVAAPATPPEAPGAPAPAAEPQNGARRGRPPKNLGRPAMRERNANLQKAMFLLSAHGGTAGRDLAAHIGITQTQWSKVINGKAEVDLQNDQLERLVANAQSHVVGLEDAISRLQKVLME